VSQHSQNSPNPEYPGQFSNPPTADLNAVEALDMATEYDLPTAPAPIAGSTTVAYGPDQMLAIYAARGKVSGSTQPIPRLMTGLKAPASAMPPPPTPRNMRSYVHLNGGTVSATVVNALPPPGPRGMTSPTIEKPPTNLRMSGPTVRGRSSTLSRASEGSNYSVDEGIGNAK